MTDEEILIAHFTECNKKRRSEAIELLEKRDFETLRKDYSSWWTRKEVEVFFDDTELPAAIKFLEKEMDNMLPNQTTPRISAYIQYEDEYDNYGVATVCVVSYVYEIKPESSCEVNSNSYSISSYRWKLKNQPNGTDTKRYLELIEKYKS